ncbi:hypothetical protein HT574_16635 [Parageobacillus sp. VR-IP]|uniref:hypothetical protein n=1 Tax=Parageobacillus sp. VR-IP TaxID=2742205 RepID=UPI0015826DC3|nr:hypothetical protein [Parageobacillus sp. VR-IP]NUK31645.1 hypothetical protein [Parageobacillus sp. VR-IP]
MLLRCRQEAVNRKKKRAVLHPSCAENHEVRLWPLMFDVKSDAGWCACRFCPGKAVRHQANFLTSTEFRRKTRQNVCRFH